MHASVFASLLTLLPAGAVNVNLTQFRTQGHVTVENVFDPAHVDWLRSQILVRRHQGIISLKGVTIADFAAIPGFSFLHGLSSHPKLLAALHEIFGERSFRYCGHNDIGIDRAVGWHKDKLNNEYAGYQTLPLWPAPGAPDATASSETQGHFIVKAAIYLQDHVADDYALRVVAGSHRSPEITPSGARTLHPPKGSVVIFEQRITHRGQSTSTDNGRVLLSLGYGLANQWTDEFEQGTKARQGNASACQRAVQRQARLTGTPASSRRAKWWTDAICANCDPGTCKLSGGKAPRHKRSADAARG